MKNLYEDFANKVAGWIGFDTTDIETTGRVQKQLFNDSFYGGQPLCNYLNYRYFDKISGNFLLTSGAAGFLLEICPLVGVNDGVVKSLNLFFAKELPKDGFLQFFLMASSDIEDFLNFWSAGRVNNHPVLKRITKSRMEHLRNRAANFHSSGKKLPRNFRIFVSYSKTCKSFNEAALSEITSFRKILVAKLASLNLQPELCATPELIRICREFFELDPSKNLNYKPISKHDTINNQCLSPANHYHHQKKGFVNLETNIIHRAYCFTQVPDFWSLAQNIELLGSREGNPLPARFCLSLTVTNDFATNKVLINRGKRVIDSSERPYSRHDKALQEEAREWRDIIHAIAKGETVLSDSFCLFISANEKDIDRSVSDIMTNLGKYSWQAAPVDYFHLEAILGAMPMHAASFWPQLKAKKLVHISLSSEVVAKLPIHGEWYGVPLSGVPFIGSRGQLFNWNPYYRLGSGNFNINVIGPSGVGKSVLLQELANAMLAQNTRIFILDIGKSYAELAKLLGGEIIEFGALSTFTINPFSGLQKGMNEVDFNQIVICAKELLAIMCGAKSEYETAILESAIKEAVIISEFNLDLKKFVKFLESSNSETLKQFGTSLFSYTPEGVYGKYFSGEKPANFTKAITIFEFEHVKDQPKLISIILQALLMQLTSQFLTGDRSQKFMVIVDEAWHMLDHSAAFFAANGRNFRRYMGSLVICTQCFADLQTAGCDQENNNHRKAIFENSAWKIILPPGSVADFEAHTEFKHKVPLLRSLSFERGQYSEMLLSTAGVDVIGRLMLDSFSASVFSTEASDFAFLKEKEEQGFSIEEAIDKLIEFKERKANAG